MQISYVIWSNDALSKIKNILNIKHKCCENDKPCIILKFILKL